MKNIIYISILSVLFFASCGPSKEDVSLLNRTLTSKVTKVAGAEKLFFQVCKTYNAEKISAELKTFMEKSKTVQKEIEDIEVDKDLIKLKEATLALVKTYIAEEAAYIEYARLYSIPTSSFTAEDERSLSANAVKINTSLDMAFT